MAEPVHGYDVQQPKRLDRKELISETRWDWIMVAMMRGQEDKSRGQRRKGVNMKT